MRESRGVTLTDYRFTGQRTEEAGLIFFNARWVDPQLGRFAQADTLIPDPGNPLSLDRYAYAYSNPVKYIDPSGHVTQKPKDDGNTVCKSPLDCYYPEQWPDRSQRGRYILPPSFGREPSIKNDGPNYNFDIGSDVLDCQDYRCYEVTVIDYYSEKGHPIDDLVKNPEIHNPMGKNDLLYFADPSILMEMQNDVNTRFLQNMGLDPDYPYNYEMVYINALKTQYTDVLLDAQRFNPYYGSSGPDFVPFIVEVYFDEGIYKEMISDQIVAWEKMLYKKYPVGGTNE